MSRNNCNLNFTIRCTYQYIIYTEFRDNGEIAKEICLFRAMTQIHTNHRTETASFEGMDKDYKRQVIAFNALNKFPAEFDAYIPIQEDQAVHYIKCNPQETSETYRKLLAGMHDCLNKCSCE